MARFGSPATACVDQAEDLSPQSSPFRDAWIGKDVRNKRVSERVLFPSPAPDSQAKAPSSLTGLFRFWRLKGLTARVGAGKDGALRSGRTGARQENKSVTFSPDQDGRPQEAEPDERDGSQPMAEREQGGCASEHGGSRRTGRALPPIRPMAG